MVYICFGDDLIELFPGSTCLSLLWSPHRPSRVDWDAEWQAVKSEDQRMSTEMIEADLDVLFANKMIE